MEKRLNRGLQIPKLPIKIGGSKSGEYSISLRYLDSMVLLASRDNPEESLEDQEFQNEVVEILSAVKVDGTRGLEQQLRYLPSVELELLLLQLTSVSPILEPDMAVGYLLRTHLNMSLYGGITNFGFKIKHSNPVFAVVDSILGNYRIFGIPSYIIAAACSWSRDKGYQFQISMDKKEPFFISVMWEHQLPDYVDLRHLKDSWRTPKPGVDYL